MGVSYGGSGTYGQQVDKYKRGLIEQQRLSNSPVKRIVNIVVYLHLQYLSNSDPICTPVATWRLPCVALLLQVVFYHPE